MSCQLWTLVSEKRCARYKSKHLNYEVNIKTPPLVYNFVYWCNVLFASVWRAAFSWNSESIWGNGSGTFPCLSIQFTMACCQQKVVVSWALPEPQPECSVSPHSCLGVSDTGWAICSSVLRIPAAGFPGALGFSAGWLAWGFEQSEEEALLGAEGCQWQTWFGTVSFASGFPGHLVGFWDTSWPSCSQTTLTSFPQSSVPGTGQPCHALRHST